MLLFKLYISTGGQERLKQMIRSSKYYGIHADLKFWMKQSTEFDGSIVQVSADLFMQTD